MLSQILKEHDLAEFEDDFKALIQPCWVGTAGKGQHITGYSKVGGLPDAPEGFTWPTFKAIPLEFICQIRCSDIEQEYFPREGLLLFFLCSGYWTDRIEDKDYIRVLHVPESAKLMPATPQFIYKKRLFGLLKPRQIPQVFKEAPLTFSKSISIPDVDILDCAFSDKMDDKDEYGSYCEVKEALSGENFIQIGGYPDPIQYDGIAESAAKAFGIGKAEDWHMILQVYQCEQTNMMWGDAGRIHYFAHQLDIEEHNFENVWLEFQCH